jgi:hypothetical protein
MATTLLALTGALAAERQRRLQAEAVRQRRISETEHVKNAAMRQARYRDAALAALVILFALLSFSLGEEDAEARRVRGWIVDPADVVLVDPTARAELVPIP